MKRALLALALAAALPFSAQAADGDPALSYSYIEGTYQSADFLDESWDGFGLAGSVAFGSNWYGSASYSQVDYSSIDLDRSTINLGWHTAISDKADFIAELGYVSYGVDAGTLGSDDANGYRAAIGLRGLMGPKFEGSIKASYEDVDGSNNVGLGVGGVFHINQTWGITGSYERQEVDGEGLNTWGLGVRASF